MNKKHLRPLTILVSSLLLSGCVLAPGMHMKNSLTPSVGAKGNILKPQKIQPISAQLIIAEQRQAEIETALAIKNYQAPKGFTTKISDYRYRVGPQDVLSIIVYNHPNLSNPTASQNTTAANTGIIVDQSGYIFYPYIGMVKVAGKTIQQIRTLISQKLSAYIKEPQVNVQVLKFNSNKVRVLGNAVSPRSLPMTNVPMTILEAAQTVNVSACSGSGSDKSTASSGGNTGGCADIQHIKISRDNITTNVNLETLKAINGQNDNWMLEPGDTIHINSDIFYRVYMLGAVNGQGPTKMINNKLNLEQAIGIAGGVQNSSDPTYTYVIRNYNKNPEIFVLNARSPDALILASEFHLKPQDVVFVSTSKLETFNQVLGQVMPSLTAYTLIRNISK